MDMAHAIWTVLLLVIFIGIVIWAWSGRQKQRFERAARAPLEEDDSHPHSVARVAGEGGEPSAQRAISSTRGERNNG